MPAYQDYTISNVIDGSASTYFWKDGGQAANDYILLTYPTAQPVYQISITFTPNDQPSGMATIEISTDNKNWQTVTEFTSSQLDASHTLTCDANGAVAKYVRFVIRYITSEYWLQVAEFNAEMSEKYTQTTDQNGDKIASLSDRLKFITIPFSIQLTNARRYMSITAPNGSKKGLWNRCALS